MTYILGWLFLQSSLMWALILSTLGIIGSWGTPHPCKILSNVPKANLTVSCSRLHVRWGKCHRRQGAGWGTLPEKNVDLSVSGGGGI